MSFAVTYAAYVALTLPDASVPEMLPGALGRSSVTALQAIPIFWFASERIERWRWMHFALALVAGAGVLLALSLLVSGSQAGSLEYFARVVSMLGLWAWAPIFLSGVLGATFRKTVVAAAAGLALPLLVMAADLFLVTLGLYGPLDTRT